MRRAIVVGSAGQDGTLLTEMLASRGFEARGIDRNDAVDILEAEAVEALVAETRPSHVYYLAAHHHTAEDRMSNDLDLFRRSFRVHVDGLVHFLEAIRRRSPGSRIFYAASSHVFGRPSVPVQSEATPMAPVCVYGITKAAGVQCCRFYRETHGVFASVGILYNHESPARREGFLSRKIVDAAVEVRAGRRHEVRLGDLSARVDWGWAADYVDAMTRILELDRADDFVVASGETHSVEEFVEAAFEAVGLDWRPHVAVDPSVLTKGRRELAGDSTKLRAATGWSPAVGFREMVHRLVEARREIP